ncbi:hypothetical protein Syun_007997 [Stephania yunnanensis]|uniref:Bet v I/Major latex protein domain-containing protein n=1 Tax=Stephania yunnanensis TaxID=152371 RepID=A0AAP0KZR9_9MAGN
MGWKRFEVEIVSTVSASRMFKAAIVDSHNLVPKLIPHIITGIKMIRDDTTGRLFKRTDFSNLIPFSYTLDRVDVMDEKNYVFNYWLIEGGRMGKMYDAGDFEVRITPTSNGGCVLKVDGAYHAYEDVVVTEDDMKVGKLGLSAMYSAVEAYLAANPEAYASA